MKQLLLRDKQELTDEIKLSSSSYHYLINVRRMKLDDEIVLSAMNGTKALYGVQEISDESILLVRKSQIPDIVNSDEMDASTSPELILGLALLKGKKLDLALRQACELGANKIALFQADHSVMRIDEKDSLKKLSRWNEIAREAFQQSGRIDFPEILYFQNLDNLLNAFDDRIRTICFYVNEKEPESLLQALHFENQKSMTPVLLLVGPEGDFSAREMKEVKKIGGHTCSLGPTVLRSETAAVAALATVAMIYREDLV